MNDLFKTHVIHHYEELSEVPEPNPDALVRTRNAQIRLKAKYVLGRDTIARIKERLKLRK